MFIGMAVGQALLPAALRAAHPAAGDPGGICGRLATMDKLRMNSLLGYSVRRRYTLSHEGSATPAIMIVQLDYSYPGNKSFRVISENNCSFLETRIMNRVLNAEVQSARDDERDKIRIVPGNYDFDLLGMADLDGRSTYVMRMTPKRKDRMLVDGKIWVDTQDAAVTRLDGELTVGSFWVRNFHMLQRYERVGPYWLLSFIRNEANVRFFGEARLDIESFDYRLRSS